jgi:hypothetical protein
MPFSVGRMEKMVNLISRNQLFILKNQYLQRRKN